jgi:hypothetical protein
VLRNGYRRLGPLRGGLGPLRVEAAPPGGLSAWTSQGAQTSHPTWEEVRCCHVPLRKRPLN